MTAVAIGAPLVLAAWGVGMIVLTLFQPAGAPVAVFARGGVTGAVEAIAAADGYLLEVKGNTVIAIAKDGGFVPRLYGSGAWLVMATSTGGCIVLPNSTPTGPGVTTPAA